MSDCGIFGFKPGASAAPASNAAPSLVFSRDYFQKLTLEVPDDSYEGFEVQIADSLGYSGNGTPCPPLSRTKGTLLLDAAVYGTTKLNNPLHQCQQCTMYFEKRKYFRADPQGKSKIMLVKNNHYLQVTNRKVTINIKFMCCCVHHSLKKFYLVFRFSQCHLATSPASKNPVVSHTTPLGLEVVVPCFVKQWRKHKRSASQASDEPAAEVNEQAIAPVVTLTKCEGGSLIHPDSPPSLVVSPSSSPVPSPPAQSVPVLKTEPGNGTSSKKAKLDSMPSPYCAPMMWNPNQLFTAFQPGTPGFMNALALSLLLSHPMPGAPSNLPTAQATAHPLPAMSSHLTVGPQPAEAPSFTIPPADPPTMASTTQEPTESALPDHLVQTMGQGLPDWLTCNPWADFGPIGDDCYLVDAHSNPHMREVLCDRPLGR